MRLLKKQKESIIKKSENIIFFVFIKEKVILWQKEDAEGKKVRALYI